MKITMIGIGGVTLMEVTPTANTVHLVLQAVIGLSTVIVQVLVFLNNKKKKDEASK